MKDRFLGGILVLLGAISFGVLSNIVKTAYKQGYTIGQVTFVQTFFGALILWLLYFIFNRSSAKARHQNSASKKNLKLEALKVIISGICPGLVGIFYYLCVQHVPASIAIILLMQYLWISVLIDYIVFKQKPSALQVIAVIIIIAGSILAAGLLNAHIEFNLEGYLFGFLAALANCLFLIVSNRVGNQMPALKKSALMITGACLTTCVIFPPLFIFSTHFADPVYLFGVILALLGTVIPPYLYSVGIPKVGLSVSAILTAVELPVAVCASYFYLKEVITLWQWIGVLVILIAIVISNVKFKAR